MMLILCQLILYFDSVHTSVCLLTIDPHALLYVYTEAYECVRAGANVKYMDTRMCEACVYWH
jgi:hypothetical protein